MNRSIVATAVATAFLSLNADAASAAPSSVSTFTKTYTLECSVPEDSSKFIIHNNTSMTIKQGAKIYISIRAAVSGGTSYVGRNEVHTTLRDIGPNTKKHFVKTGAMLACWARVTLPKLDTKIATKRVVR